MDPAGKLREQDLGFQEQMLQETPTDLLYWMQNQWSCEELESMQWLDLKNCSWQL